MKNKKYISSALAIGMIGVLTMTPLVSKPFLSQFKKDLNGMFTKNSIPKNSVSLLFVQQAQFGSVKADKSKQGCYTFTMSKLKKHVAYFYNEPKRTTGYMTVGTFENLIHHNAKNYNVKPNVAVLAYERGADGKVKEFSDIAVLLNPQYNTAKNTMTYQMCPLKKRTITPAQRLEWVTIFFDNFKPWPA